MKLFSNNKNTLLVGAALLSFFAIGILYFVSVVYDVNNRIRKESQKNLVRRVYLNKNYSDSDPFITKNPSLEDMLTGPIISELDPILGNSDAPVSIVEFADYTCYFCYQEEQLLKKIIKDYKDRVNLVWKDYPEGEINSISWQAAIAARCAGEQGKFWEYHSKLFENYKNLSNDLFKKIANQLNLNIKEFESCQKSEKIISLIKDNIDEANALDIEGIPFIYINDQEVMGYMGEEDLKKIIDLELNR